MSRIQLARCFQLVLVLAVVGASGRALAQDEDANDAAVEDPTTATSGAKPDDYPADPTPPPPAPTTPREQARTLYREGEAAYKAGRYLEAVSHFKQAAHHEPNAALSYNIALAYEAVGQIPEALHWYRDYLRELPQAPDRNEVRTSIRRLEARLEKLGVQQVSILSDPDGAQVRLDDEIVGTTPWTGQTTPGSHRVQLSLAGYAPSTVEFTLAEDRALDVRLVLTERGATPTSPATAPASVTPAGDSASERDRSRARVRARTWVLLGGGMGLLGTAVGFELARSSAEQQARDTEIQLDARESIDRMRRFESTARTFAAVGGVVTAVGAVSLVFDLRSSRPRRARVVPDATCGFSGCWLGARGRF